MKAIAVLNLPFDIEKGESCYITLKDGYYQQKAVLKPLPEKIDDCDNDLTITRGWNACIDEITGEKEW